MLRNLGHINREADVALCINQKFKACTSSCLNSPIQSHPDSLHFAGKLRTDLSIALSANTYKRFWGKLGVIVSFISPMQNVWDIAKIFWDYLLLKFIMEIWTLFADTFADTWYYFAIFYSTRACKCNATYSWKINQEIQPQICYKNLTLSMKSNKKSAKHCKKKSAKFTETCLWKAVNRAIITENVHRVCKNIWFLYACVLSFHACFAFISTHMYAFIWYETWKSSELLKVEFQFKSLKNGPLSNGYISYVKSETSDIWRTGEWLLKPFGERVEENHTYDLVKPSSTVKTRGVYRRCNVCCQFFGENGKIDFKVTLMEIWKSLHRFVFL